MKLQTPPWKTAWHDHHLSERFLKEWNRMEGGPLRDIAGTSAWMDQLMIELGQLAQSMIHLEESRTHASHLRLAAERALKLSVLAARLAGSLDATYRESTTDAAEFLLNESSAAGAPGGAVDSAALAQPAPAAASGSGYGNGQGKARPTALRPAEPPQAIAAVPATPAQTPTPASVQAAEAASSPAAPRAERPQTFMAQVRDPRMLMQPRKAPATTPEQERLVLAGPARNLESANRANERPMSLTIKTLSDRGLSLDEIELVTGQPRSTIQTVLSTH